MVRNGFGPGEQGSDLRANVCFEAELVHGQMKARRAIDSIAIEQGHGWHLMGSANLRQFLGDGSSFEKTERRARVEFDVQIRCRNLALKGHAFRRAVKERLASASA